MFIEAVCAIIRIYGEIEAIVDEAGRGARYVTRIHHGDTIDGVPHTMLCSSE